VKTFIASLLIASALVLSARADETAKISNVHLCCPSCVNGVDKAVADVSGVKATSDRTAGTVVLTGPDKASLQKATDALVAAGYFGTSTDVKLDATTGAKDTKVQTLTIKNLHLCCGKCVAAVDKIVKTVPGVTGQTATKGATSFDVTGDFNGKDVMDALQKGGLTGKVAN
jgi:copper chaperone CopZ